MGSGLRLQVVLGVPVGVEDDHGVRRSQVDPQAPSPCGEQETEVLHTMQHMPLVGAFSDRFPSNKPRHPDTPKGAKESETRRTNFLEANECQGLGGRVDFHSLSREESGQGTKEQQQQESSCPHLAEPRGHEIAKPTHTSFSRGRTRSSQWPSYWFSGGRRMMHVRQSG